MKSTLVRRHKGKRIAGVCGGIAQYLGADPLLIRLLAVFAAFFTGFGLVVFLYIVAWVLLDEEDENEAAVEAVKIKTNTWQAGKTPSSAISFIDEKLKAMDLRIRNMEQYVTSDAFKINREINRL